METPEKRFCDTLYGNEGFLFFIKQILTDLHIQKKSDIDPSLINLAIIFIKKINKDDIISNFINESYNYWNEIASKDENFLVNHCDIIFSGVSKEYIEKFKQLFINKKINSEDKNILWDYLFSFVKISISYIHESRSPKIIDDKPAYSNKNFPDVKLQKCSKTWNVELDWKKEKTLLLS